MFRRLYWVTEQLDAAGQSTVTGVYTSVPDLISRGLRWVDESDSRHSFRLTLVKLDSADSPLGCWSGPDFSGFEEEMQQFVETKEFSVQEVMTAADGLRSWCGAAR